MEETAGLESSREKQGETMTTSLYLYIQLYTFCAQDLLDDTLGESEDKYFRFGLNEGNLISNSFSPIEPMLCPFFFVYFYFTQDKVKIQNSPKNPKKDKKETQIKTFKKERGALKKPQHIYTFYPSQLIHYYDIDFYPL